MQEAHTWAVISSYNKGNGPHASENPAILIDILRGPNANTAQIMGGGSAKLSPHYAVTPFDGITAKLSSYTNQTAVSSSSRSPDHAPASAVEITYALDYTNHKWMPPLSIDQIAGRKFTQTFFGSPDLSGPVIHRAATTNAEQLRLNEVTPGAQIGPFSMRLHGRYTPLESGRHRFSLISAGRSRLLIDGEQVVDNWTHQTPGDYNYGSGSAEVVTAVPLNAGQTYELALEYSKSDGSHAAAVRLGHLPPISDEAIKEAAVLAAAADVALIFVGLSGDWETEGHDRLDMELPGQQVALIEQVAAANPNTAVILQTGSPISMPWLDQVPAVLQAWYPGQECGNAIADVIFGDINPSGKLPQTFPVRLEDNPAYINYPGENSVVRYGEGIFVGYRYYEKKKLQPLFSFGHGLSYTSFTIDNLRLSAAEIGPEDELVVSVNVTNAGERAGQEVVQLYISDSQSTLSRPMKELKGFAKINLQPGETQALSLTIDKTALAFWDDKKQAWVAEAGQFIALVGNSSQNIAARASFNLSETAVFGGPIVNLQQLT